MIKVTDNNIWHGSIINQDTYGPMVNMDKHLGVEIIEIGDDYVVAKMPVTEKTKQPFGILHEAPP